MADWDKITLADLERERIKLMRRVDSAVRDFNEKTGYEAYVSAGFSEGDYDFDIDVRYPTGKG